METVFLETVNTTLHPKLPIAALGFLDHNESRYDTIVLCDADEMVRYKLIVVDRNLTGAFQRPISLVTFNDLHVCGSTHLKNQNEIGGVNYKQLLSAWVAFESLLWTENL
jgi:hypothetical protein